ncbi:MAG: ATP-binding protein, partial [Anaerolineae bacterium]|nr:ATP-binding protein [Anaerolineae bacterium]
MYEFDLSAAQQELIDLPFPSTTCLTGPAGAGKTTAALAYLSNLVSQGIRQENICIIAPQRNLLDPYLRLINAREFPAGAPPRLMTFGGLARRMVSLFWPLVIEPAGFSGASKYPTFLTHETAQYHLAKLASPLIQNERYFEGAAIHPSRLYSQIIDNLNKAAIVGYPYQANAEKLRAAWTGDSTACIIYDQAQHCSQLFREYCLQNNLLDFSLQVEVFRDFIWNSELFKKYWYGGNKHLIYDNAEEDAPVFHDLVLDWMPDLESALFIMDDDGGYRTFLAADPISADRIKDSCRRVLQFENSFVQSPEVSQVTALLSRAIHGEWLDKRTQDLPSFKVFTHRFIPEMVTAVCHYCAD